jgi:hypothetical protein
MVNKVVSLLNKLIESANSLPWINIPLIAQLQIPRLATGWIVQWPTLGEHVAAAQKFQSGWIVQWPWWVDKVPAMLTAWELVLNKSQQANLASQLNWWWGGKTLIVEVKNNQFAWVSDEFAEQIGNLVMQDLAWNTIFQSY